ANRRHDRLSSFKTIREVNQTLTFGTRQPMVSSCKQLGTFATALCVGPPGSTHTVSIAPEISSSDSALRQLPASAETLCLCPLRSRQSTSVLTLSWRGYLP